MPETETVEEERPCTWCGKQTKTRKRLIFGVGARMAPCCSESCAQLHTEYQDSNF